jgi:hypothetical protein
MRLAAAPAARLAKLQKYRRCLKFALAREQQRPLIWIMML